MRISAVCCALLALSLSVGFWTPVSAQEDPLVVGIFPRRSPAATQKMFAPLTSYLAAEIGREVRLETSPDFHSFWDSLKKGMYDVVHYNQYHYVRSKQEAGYRVIVKNEEFGRSKIGAGLVARRDSGIETVHDLKGKKVVFGGGRTAMQSYITATYLLRQAGLKQGDYFVQFALTPPKACIAAYYRQASAAGAGDIVLELPHVRKGIDVAQMTYLATSEPLAHLPWAVGQRVSNELANKIQKVLVSLKRSARGRRVLSSAGLTGLVAANDSEYDPHRKIIAVVLGEHY